MKREQEQPIVENLEEETTNLGDEIQRLNELQASYQNETHIIKEQAKQEKKAYRRSFPRNHSHVC